MTSGGTVSVAGTAEPVLELPLRALAEKYRHLNPSLRLPILAEAQHTGLHRKAHELVRQRRIGCAIHH